MTTALDDYFDSVTRQLAGIRASQHAALEQAADWVAQALLDERFIFAFGAGHSHALAEELFYRAGGLVRVVPIFDEKLMMHVSAAGSTDWERKEGYAETVLARYSIAAGDLLFVVSNSGRNAVPIEIALGGQRRGAKVIAIVSERYCGAYPSRHSSGKKLVDVAEMVIDNGGEAGDAVVTIAGLLQSVGPTSTIACACILNAIVAEAVARTVARGGRPEVWTSANKGAGDANVELLSKYRGRIPHL